MKLIGSLGVLALLDHEGSATANRLAELCRLTAHTIRQHLNRMEGYQQVMSEQPLNPREGTAPSVEKIWSLTRRGKSRLDWKGGHKENCPLCK